MNYRRVRCWRLLLQDYGWSVTAEKVPIGMGTDLADEVGRGQQARLHCSPVGRSPGRHRRRCTSSSSWPLRGAQRRGRHRYHRLEHPLELILPGLVSRKGERGRGGGSFNQGVHYNHYHYVNYVLLPLILLTFRSSILITAAAFHRRSGAPADCTASVPYVHPYSPEGDKAAAAVVSGRRLSGAIIPSSAAMTASRSLYLR